MIPSAIAAHFNCLTPSAEARRVAAILVQYAGAGATDLARPREKLQPQHPCDEGLLVAIFSRWQTHVASLDIRPPQPGPELLAGHPPRVSLAVRPRSTSSSSTALAIGV